MAQKNVTEPLRISCECGKWVAVNPEDAGSAVKCVCGRRVEVPLLDEFEGRSELISATTLEARILRLVRVGELPMRDGCVVCETVSDLEIIPTILECETSSVHYRDSVSVIWVPGIFSIWTYKEEKPEVFGNDTSVPAPVCLCKQCQTCLHSKKTAYFLWPVLIGVLFGGMAAYFHIVAGVAMMIVTVLIGTILFRYWSIKSRQKLLKNILSRVPVYRQMLDSYPYAVVIIPAELKKAVG